ncbi:MAG TPA: DUF2269 family protein [Deltaproteobacteria bacterium]|nr:DUF2269 family protein [Deltaproteobacteria bacterium]
MKKMGIAGKRRLKCIHLICACLWVGGAVSLTLMTFLMIPAEKKAVYGIHHAMKFIDDFIIIPGAMGLLLTGLAYSAFTEWGWFRHRWILAKWIVNVYGIVFGTFWLGPWVNSLASMATDIGSAAMSNPVYLHNVDMLRIWGTLQVSTIVFALVISVLKPFKQRIHAQQRKT